MMLQALERIGRATAAPSSQLSPQPAPGHARERREAAESMRAAAERIQEAMKSLVPPLRSPTNPSAVHKGLEHTVFDSEKEVRARASCLAQSIEKVIDEIVDIDNGEKVQVDGTTEKKSTARCA